MHRDGPAIHNTSGDLIGICPSSRLIQSAHHHWYVGHDRPMVTTGMDRIRNSDWPDGTRVRDEILSVEVNKEVTREARYACCGVRVSHVPRQRMSTLQAWVDPLNHIILTPVTINIGIMPSTQKPVGIQPCLLAPV